MKDLYIAGAIIILAATISFLWFANHPGNGLYELLHSKVSDLRTGQLIGIMVVVNMILGLRSNL